MVFVLVCYKFSFSRKDRAWLVGGLAFTVGADWFLVINNSHLPGVAIFCFAHVCYICRGLNAECRFAFGLFGVVGLIAFTGFLAESIFILAGLYGVLFFINICVYVFKKTHLPRCNHALMLVGLIFFALCDFNVLLYNLPLYFEVNFFSDVSYLLIWIFYLPSQALIAISGLKPLGKTLGETFSEEKVSPKPPSKRL